MLQSLSRQLSSDIGQEQNEPNLHASGRQASRTPAAALGKHAGLHMAQCSDMSGCACARCQHACGQVTTKNLERVRKVKGRHQRLLMRVRAFREELQRFLEDDDDMIKLCLTRKRDLERALAASGDRPSPLL